MRIFTVGHSTRSLEELLTLCRAHGIELIADVRRFPASRRHPHFAKAALEDALAAAAIGYAWLPGLGGRRSRRVGSPHTAWRVAAFAGFADHMETEEFLEAAQTLLAHAREARTAVMCAEALPRECHRRLIADWLTVQGNEVDHILGEKRVERHRLPDFARIEGERILYDGGQLPLP